MDESRLSGAASAVVIAFIVIAACQLAQAVVEPVVFAIFVIEVTWPLHKALQSKLPKAAALMLSVAITSAVVLALFSLIAWSGRAIADWVQQNLDRIQTTLLSSTAWLEEHDIFVLALVTDHFNAASLIRFFHAAVVRANTVLAFAVLVLLYVIMGLAETEAFQKKIAALKNHETSRRLLTAGRRIGEKFRTYMFVRTIASIATGLAVWGFALFMGLELAGAWGVLAFALNYLPYIGSVVVTALLALFAFVQTGSGETAAIVLVGVMAIQFVIGSYLEPVFSGSALSISPTVVMFAVVLWTFLWGALGAFLGIPLAIAALEIFAQFPSTRWVADLLCDQPIEAPPLSSPAAGGA